MAQGYFALVLHAHLPYIRHPQDPGIMEERWLFEAVTECYLPLLRSFERMVKDGVKFKITLSLSPPLIGMLNDQLLQERYVRHISRLIKLAEKEVERNKYNQNFRDVALMYYNRLNELRRSFENDYGGNHTTAPGLQALGALESSLPAPRTATCVDHEQGSQAGAGAGAIGKVYK